MLPRITLGEVSVDLYKTMMYIGLAGMLIHILHRRKKVSLSIWQSVAFWLIMIVSGLTGAYLLGFVQWLDFGPINMFGAIFTVPVAMTVVGKLFKMTSMQANDISAICLAIVNTFVKVGCVFAGCCEGVVLYVGNRYFQWPAQIVGCIAGTIIILWLLRKEASEKWRGSLYPLFMLSYGLMRFFLNYLTYIPVKWIGLQPSQWFGLLSAVIGLLWLVIYQKRS